MRLTILLTKSDTSLTIIYNTGVIIPDPNTMKSNAMESSSSPCPQFTGNNDPEEYLSWALKVDKIFRLHNYEEEKKISMASLEFQDYVLICWEQVLKRREARGEPPITTWAQTKDVMRARFVPTYYNRDLFK